jgi:hypothetical protein
MPTAATSTGAITAFGFGHAYGAGGRAAGAMERVAHVGLGGDDRWTRRAARRAWGTV